MVVLSVSTFCVSVGSSVGATDGRLVGDAEGAVVGDSEGSSDGIRAGWGVTALTVK